MADEPEESQQDKDPRQLAFRIGVGSLFLAVVLGFAFFETTRSTGMLWWKKEEIIPFSERAPYLFGVVLMILTSIGAFGFAMWSKMEQATRERTSRRQGKLLLRYGPVLKGVDEITFTNLASITGKPVKRVQRDLTTLVNGGSLPETYLDHQAGRLVNKRHIPDSSTKVIVACNSCGASEAILTGVPQRCGACDQWLYTE